MNNNIINKYLNNRNYMFIFDIDWYYDKVKNIISKYNINISQKKFIYKYYLEDIYLNKNIYKYYINIMNWWFIINKNLYTWNEEINWLDKEYINW